MATKTKKSSPKVIKSSFEETPPVTKNNSKFFTYLVVVILLGLALFLLAKRYRGAIIAGMVNTTPITRWELNKVLTERYGKATLDDLIANKLIKQLAAQNNITVSQDDIAKETKSLEDRLGGKEALQASMDRFGINQAKLNEEIYSVLLQRKLSEKLFQVKVEDTEIEKYYNDNKTLFPNKSLEEVKDSIRQNLVQQKLQEQFSTWFQDQQKKAQIKIFI